MTLGEIAETLGLKGTGSLRRQIQLGVLKAEKIGAGAHSIWLVSEEEFQRYDEQRKQPRGFASPDHPLHGKRGGGGRSKKSDI